MIIQKGVGFSLWHKAFLKMWKYWNTFQFFWIFYYFLIDFGIANYLKTGLPERYFLRILLIDFKILPQKYFI